MKAYGCFFKEGMLMGGVICNVKRGVMTMEYMFVLSGRPSLVSSIQNEIDKKA